MTNHWTDLANSDRILIIGSNAAENHPLSFKWVVKALEKGAKLISVDPRFTRTSALADIYAPLRSGTDIAFIGGIIKYAIDKDMIQRDYLLAHTNAAFLVDPAFTFEDGLFGAIENEAYTKKDWSFQYEQKLVKEAWTDEAGGAHPAVYEKGVIKKDPSLQDPNCVYQLLKKHYERYDLETVSSITGTPVDKLCEVAEAFCYTHAPDKSGTIMYAMGTTQHTHGVQNVRSYAVLQLLLGNVGMAGGGINALRGESNVQGSTDAGLLFHILPGYLKAPVAEDVSLQAYLEHYTPKSADPRSANWWSHTPKYSVSQLKAFWGEHATPANDFAYHYLPKRGGKDYSHMALFEAMGRGEIKGLVALGQNPAVGGPNSRVERKALEQLEWLVAVDVWETETMAFWEGPEANAADIKTEVFMLPAAASMEKEGSVSNSGRWAQWRYTAADPPGEAKSDLWILDRILHNLRERYAQEGGAFPNPLMELSWDYGDGHEPDPHLVAKEINGYFLADTEFGGTKFKKGDLVPAFAALAADGTTSSGNWLYCASYTNAGNMMARRKRSAPDKDPLGLHAEWSWCWPVNRRILYNRASCDAQGRPYAPKKSVVAYDWVAGAWKGDVPDGPWPPMAKPDGSENPEGRYSFIMQSEGYGALFSAGLADGPFPEHYEPLESPVPNLMSKQEYNPVIKIWRPEEIGLAADYPIVATTYRVTEHWQAGTMTRNLPWLAELVPNAFVEMSRELAELRGIQNGDMVKVSSKRGDIELHAVVTPRFKPFKVAGKTLHQVGVIWQFGYKGIATGPSGNVLTPHVGDPNTMIPEFKAFLCDVTLVGSGRVA